MKLNQKAQHLIEYMLLIAAVVTGVLAATGPNGPMKGAVERSLNRAVDTIYGDYFWKLGTETACSVAPGCGNGTRTRTVTCSNATGGIVDDGFCAGKGAKPDTKLDCYIPCGGNDWWKSGWGLCSAACGDGVQTQTVECHDSGGNKVADALCSGEKPPTSQVCNNGCYAWWADDVNCSGLCSAPCGVGTCPRSVVCKDTRTDMAVADGYCSGSKPEPTKTCDTKLYCGYQWVVGDWSNCDQTCGDGLKYRSVECRRIIDNVVSEGNCGPPKPDDHKPCNLGPCNHWGVKGGWSDCSVNCGPGKQSAIIKCYDKDNREIEDTSCDPATKPSSTRSCSYGPCPVCSKTIKSTCDIGTPGDINVGSCGGKATWTCSSGKDTKLACSLDNPPCAVCGNGTTEIGEECDAGDATHGDGNGICPKWCSFSCTNNSCGICGNKIKEFPEECDLGDATHGDGNGICPKGCSFGCKDNDCSCNLGDWGSYICVEGDQKCRERSCTGGGCDVMPGCDTEQCIHSACIPV